MENEILGSPRTSFVVPSLRLQRGRPLQRSGQPRCQALAVAPWGAERSEAGLGTTKEVLGFIIDFLDFKDFLGFPILLLGFPRIS